jgi:hypothetical protein
VTVRLRCRGRRAHETAPHDASETDAAFVEVGADQRSDATVDMLDVTEVDLDRLGIGHCLVESGHDPCCVMDAEAPRETDQAPFGRRANRSAMALLVMRPRDTSFLSSSTLRHLAELMGGSGAIVGPARMSTTGATTRP